MLLNFFVPTVESKLEKRGQLGNLIQEKGLEVSPVNYASQGIDKGSVAELHSTDLSEIMNPREYNLTFLDGRPLYQSHYMPYLKALWHEAKDKNKRDLNREWNLWTNRVKRMFGLETNQKPSRTATRTAIFKKMMQMEWPRKIAGKDYFNTFERHHTPEGFKKLFKSIKENRFNRRFPLGTHPFDNNKTYGVFDGSHRAAVAAFLKKKGLLSHGRVTFLSMPFNATKTAEYRNHLNGLPAETLKERAENLFSQNYDTVNPSIETEI
jgi:hypothetical protein